jgi:tripartite-type tricarboxylate transporter receptor subunit TctC
LPDVPTVGEFLSGYEATSWQGLAAPKGTPVEIVERLSKEASAAIADATLKSRIENLGYATFPMASAELTRFIADETEKWAKVIRVANIKAN